MVAVPPVIPLIIPEEVPIVATGVHALVHVPPVDASLNVVVEPVHMVFVPVIAGIAGSTVILIVSVTEQPKVSETVIMYFVMPSGGLAMVVSQVVQLSPVDGVQL